jgi:cell division septation protein DedD
VRMLNAWLVLGVATAAALSGCVSSEETGGAGRTQTPQPVMRSTELAPPALPVPAVKDSVPRTSAQTPAAKVKRTAPTFRTKQDTVRAAMVRSQKPSGRTSAPIERPANPQYTIQIGAYGRAENALRAQRHARKLFPDIPVLNVYVPAAKLYRVSVGRFESRAAANRFRLEIVKHYPNEYAQCWINYAAR